MIIKIIGETLALQDKIDGFRENLRSELKSKRKKVRKKLFVTLIIYIVFMLGLYVLSQYNFSSLICSIIPGVISIIAFVLLFNGFLKVEFYKSDEKIEDEVNEKTNSFFGNSLDILKLFYEGKLISATVEEYTELSFPVVNNRTTYVHPSIRIKFEYINCKKTLGVCCFSPGICITDEKKYQGVLELDLETGYAKYYEHDEFYNGQILEICNQQ